MSNTNIVAILSLIFSFLIFPLGLIFGIIALVQIKKTNQNGKGLAIAGIIISIVLPLIILMFGLLFVRSIFG